MHVQGLKQADMGLLPKGLAGTTIIQEYKIWEMGKRTHTAEKHIKKENAELGNGHKSPDNEFQARQDTARHCFKHKTQTNMSRGEPNSEYKTTMGY